MKFLTKFFFFLTIVFLVFIPPLLAETNAIDKTTKVASSTDYSSLSNIKDVVNILFFIVMGFLGVLSYRQAKKTIFTPLKTETFKLQLKLFENIFSFFDQHQKTKFVESLDYRKILAINMSLLLNNYVGVFFKDKLCIDVEKRDRLLKEAPLSNMAFKHIDKFEHTDNGLKLDFSNIKIETQDPEQRLAEWSKFEFIMVRYTLNFQNQMDQLDSFISSPIIPSQIKKLLREFQIKAFQNLHLMAEVLTDVAKELPQKYTSAGSVAHFDDSWVWNIYNDKRFRLEKISDQIYQNINDYLNIEKLLR